MTVDWLHFFSELVELLVGISWPLAGAICIIYALQKFNKPLSDILGRLREIKKGDASIALNQQSLSLSMTDNRPRNPLDGLEHIDPVYHPFIEAVGGDVESYIESVPASQNRSREDLLRTLLVGVYSSLTLERTLPTMLKSQIDVLDYLALRHNRASRADVRVFYDSAASKSPDVYADFSFETWLEHFFRFNLLEVDGEDLVLTPKGQALMPHARATNMTLPAVY